MLLVGRRGYGSQQSHMALSAHATPVQVTWSQDPALHAVGPMGAFARDLLGSSIPPRPTPFQSSLALTQGAERKTTPLPPASRLPAPSPRADGPEGAPSATLEDTLSQEEVRILGVLLGTATCLKVWSAHKSRPSPGPSPGCPAQVLTAGPQGEGT